MSSIFDVEEYIAKASLQGTSTFLYGLRKIGKTTLASKFPKSFIVGFEMGWGGLNKVKARPVKDWNHFRKDFVKPLVQQAKDFQTGKIKQKVYETIIIDTADIAYNYCTDFINAQEGVTHLDYTENKRGYKMVKNEFAKQMFLLMSSGYTLVFISHADTKQVTNLINESGTIRKVKEDKTVPTLDKNAYAILSGAVDTIAYCGNMEMENGDIKRVVFFRDNGSFEAGGRWSEFLPEYVDLNYKAFESAIVKAIEAKAKVDGVDPHGNHENRNLYQQAEESIVYDFEAIMAEISIIGNYLHSVNKLPLLTKISDESLGVGKKVSACTEIQVEVVHSILCEIKEKMEEADIVIPEE